VREIADQRKPLADAALTRGSPWRWSARGVWLGLLAFVASLIGTELLGRDSLRLWTVLLLLSAGALAVIAWSNSQWSAAFPVDEGAEFGGSQLQVWRRRPSLAMLAGAVLIAALSHVAFLASPRETFGAAGGLWLTGMALVIAAAALWSGAKIAREGSQTRGQPTWKWWEEAVVAFIAVMALALRVWNLRDVPFNIYPDEIMTGLVAERAYLSGPGPAPCLFSTPEYSS
jgi:hypothetical protein